MNIVLIGYRGTGKSVVGRLLSKTLKRSLFSLDKLIEEKAGRSIPRIVADSGWPAFREIESEIVRDVCGQAENAVIDCGGGVVLDPGNVEILKKNGSVVLLTADFDVLLKRLRHDPNRPALKEGLSFEEEQRRILEDRRVLYQSTADYVFDTTKNKPKETVNEIINQLKKKSPII